ncbi:MAG: PDGLE domain-containing protein [Candidatus Brocadiia bacterium]
MTRRVWGFVLAGLLVSVLLAAFVSPFASQAPEVLEKLAKDHRFAEKGEGHAAWQHPLMPDYKVPGVRSESVGTALAGIAGTLLVFGVAFGAARLISRKRPAVPEGQQRL